MTDTYQPKRLPLVLFPDAALLQQSAHIEKVTEDIRNLAADMVATMEGSDGVGLAAVQVGRHVRLFVMKDGDKALVLVNPVWAPSAGSAKNERQEGCLSFPGVFEMVQRYDSVEVSYQDLNGKECFKTLQNTEAHIVQHEVEHLDGHIFIEHLPLHVRNTIRQKSKQRARLTARIGKVLKLGDRGIQQLMSMGAIKPRPGFRK